MKSFKFSPLRVSSSSPKASGLSAQLNMPQTNRNLSWRQLFFYQSNLETVNLWTHNLYTNDLPFLGIPKPFTTPQARQILQTKCANSPSHSTAAAVSQTTTTYIVLRSVHSVPSLMTKWTRKNSLHGWTILAESAKSRRCGGKYWGGW